MKLVFEGESLEQIYDQVLATAAEIQGNDAAEKIAGSIPLPMNQTRTTAPAFPVDMQAEVTRPSGGPAVDVRGMPFDSRIHVGVEKKNKDGSWLNKRVGKEKVAEIEAELMGGKAPVAAAAPVLPTPGHVAPFPGMPQQQYQQRVEQGNAAALPPMAPVAPAAPVAPVTPAAPAIPQMGAAHAHTLETFKKNLPLVLMELTNSNPNFVAYIPTLKAHFQVTELVDVVNNDGLLAALFDTLTKYNFVKKVQ